MNCSKCNASAPEGAKFCTQCGGAIVSSGTSSKQTAIQNTILVVITALLIGLIIQNAR